MATRVNPAEDLTHLLSKVRKRVDPDIKLRCGDKEYLVHSFLLEDMSSFFDKVCNGPFKESHTREINLVEDDPQAVKAFVNFLYERDYDTTRDDNKIIIKCRYHAAAYYFAMKYDIKLLAEVASIGFASAIPTRNLNIITSDMLGELVSCVYSFDTISNTPDAIRKILCGFLLSQHQFLSHKALMDATQEYPEVWRDMVFTWRDWASKREEVPVTCSKGCGGSLKCTISCSKCSPDKPQRAHRHPGVLGKDSMWALDGPRPGTYG